MNKKGFFSLMTTLAVAVVLVLAGVFVAPRQVGAESIEGTRSITVLSSAGSVTTTVNSDAAYTQLYGTADCFSTYVATSNAAAGQTMTVKLQSSADSSNWADNDVFAQQVGAGTVLKRVTAYGAFLRAQALVSSTQAITFTIKCTLKNSVQ